MFNRLPASFLSDASTVKDVQQKLTQFAREEPQRKATVAFVLRQTCFCYLSSRMSYCAFHIRHVDLFYFPLCVCQSPSVHILSSLDVSHSPVLPLYVCLSPCVHSSSCRRSLVVSLELGICIIQQKCFSQTRRLLHVREQEAHD